MSKERRTVLYLDLKKRTAELKVHSELHELIGGLGTSLKLLGELRESDPIVISVGPLNSALPYASKTCAVFYDENGDLIETYSGGWFPLVFSLMSFDSLVITGQADQPLFVNCFSDKVEFVGEGESNVAYALSGSSSRLTVGGDESLIDNYFQLDSRLSRKLWSANLSGLFLDSNRSFEIQKVREYQKVYNDLLLRGRELTVPYGNFASCGGCPAGCSLSAVPEFNPNLTLSYCLVACGYAGKIFENIPTVFSCLQSLGYDYSHEELEKIPALITNLRREYAHA